MIITDQAMPEEECSFGPLFWIFVVIILLIATAELGMIVYGIFNPVGNHSKRKIWLYTLYGILHVCIHLSGFLQDHIFKSCLMLAHRKLYITSLFTSAILTSLEFSLYCGERINSIGFKVAFQIVFGGLAQALVAKFTSLAAAIGIIVSVFISTKYTANFEFYCFYVLTLSSVNSLLFALLRSFDQYQKLLINAAIASSKANNIITEIDAEFNNSFPEIMELLNHLFELQGFFEKPNSLTSYKLREIRLNINCLIAKKQKIIEKQKMAEIEIQKCLKIANDLHEYDNQEHYSISIKIETEKKLAFLEKELTFFMVFINEADNFLKIIEEIKNDVTYDTHFLEILNSQLFDILLFLDDLKGNAIKASKDSNQDKIELIKSEYYQKIEELKMKLRLFRKVANFLLLTAYKISCIYTIMIYYFPTEEENIFLFLCKLYEISENITNIAKKDSEICKNISDKRCEIEKVLHKDK